VKALLLHDLETRARPPLAAWLRKAMSLYHPAVRGHDARGQPIVIRGSHDQGEDGFVARAQLGEVPLK
jgi:hypothetical protein